MASAPQPAEERSYLWFMASALVLTLVAGLTLPFLIAAGERGVAPWSLRLDSLIQAHGALQLQGWAGLVVAGMGLRMVPRLAGRRPMPRMVTLSILVLMLLGVLLRTAAQTFVPMALAGTLLLGGAMSSGIGMLAFAIAAAWTLAIRRVTQSWALATWAACVWWSIWAAVTVYGAMASSDGILPSAVNGAANWIGLLGAVGNFVWAVQSRSVPVFYGRQPPSVSRFAPPLALYNLGIAAIAISLISTLGGSVLPGLGLVAVGLGAAWLAPIAGSIGGTARRLRPASQPAAAFIIAANLWAVAAGVLMIAGGVLGLATGQPPTARLRDATYHAFAIGVVTILIVGMAQVITPVFAIQRARLRTTATMANSVALFTLVGATAVRAIAGALSGAVSAQTWAALIAVAGTLAWIGLAAFAFGMGTSWLRQDRLKVELVAKALDKKSRGT